MEKLKKFKKALYDTEQTTNIKNKALSTLVVDLQSPNHLCQTKLQSYHSPLITTQTHS